MLVAQTASVTAGGDRAAWLRDMFTGLAAEPDVVGAIYFNTDNGHEFRVHSKSAGIPLDPTFKSGYQKWSPPSEADWLFDGRLDDWVTARGGTPAVWPPRTDDPPPATDIFAADQGVTTRVGGATALGSAIAISKARFTADTARHVVLSRDDRFPDALAGTPLVGDGPLLLTPTAALHSAVRSELDRVLPKGGRVYLLGGPGALAPGISDSLTAAGYDVVRLAGSDRLATSVVIADAVATLYPASAETVLVARGFGTADNPTAAWADSVTGGGFAASRRHPVVLSESHALSSDAANFLRGRREAILLGGPGALSERVRSDSAARVSQVRRVAGTGRDLTAVAIMSQLWQRPPGEFRMIAIDGYSTQGWAFGLPAAGLSADFAAPLLLVEANAVPKATADTVRSCHSKRVATAIVGAPQVISDAVRNAIEALDHSC